jgi:hypothetical protein
LILFDQNLNRHKLAPTSPVRLSKNPDSSMDCIDPKEINWYVTSIAPALKHYECLAENLLQNLTIEHAI